MQKDNLIVLAVDDDMINLKLLKSMLKKSGKVAEVIEARNGSDAIGAQDGIYFRSGVQDSLIKNNFIKNWNHASIGLTGSSENNKITGNEISYNTLTSPDIAYGGRLAYSGYVTKNNIHHNLITQISVRNQFGGYNNQFHHNIIDGVLNSHIKDPNIGQCIALEAYNGDIYGNTFSNNTLKNCDGAAIKLISTGQDVSVIVENNTFSNNLIENNGLDDDPRRTLPKKQEAEIYFSQYGNDIKQQKFTNNYLSRDNIFYRGDNISITTFNTKESNSNNTNASKIGKGAGNRSQVGSNLIYK